MTATTQARFGAYGVNTRPYLDVAVPHFHVCNGARPTASPDSPPAFWQFEAWEVREMVLAHVERVIEREAAR